MTWLSKAWLKHVNTDDVPGFTLLGEHHESLDNLYVSAAGREAGMYVVGASGSGKSGELENICLQDICAADRAVVFIDYHGDTARNILAAIPPEHLHRVALFDLTDESWPFSLNLFTRDNLESPTAVRVAVNRIMHLFTSLWPETAGHAHLPNFVRSAVYTLLPYEDTTLYDMYRMFTEPAYRQKLADTLPWENIKQYWRDFDSLTKESREARSQAVISRLNALFMGDPLMANVLGQAPGRSDFKRIITNREVVIVKLAGRQMEYESRLVGGILLAQLQAAVFSGSELDPDDRYPVSAFVDEVQAIATPDIKTFFDEGRKYRISLTISNQRLNQLEPELHSAAVAAKTIVCFRLGLEDSRELAPLFNSGETFVDRKDVAPNACQRLLDKGSDEPIVQNFVDYYLRPLNGFRVGSRIKIENPGESARDDMQKALGVSLGIYDQKTVYEAPRIDDPIPWLDDLFRRCMETGDHALPIPVLAIAGFANTGPGFWPQVRRLLDNNPILQPGYRFSDNLVARGAGGEVWINPEPDNGRDQLLHCIFCIRAVMEHLANNPVGTESTTSDKDIAQILRNLPKRACAVRTGDLQGVLYTLDNPPHVTGTEMKQRLTAVLEQTHDRYCRTRAEVEATRQPAQKPVSTPKSRWEQR